MELPQFLMLNHEARSGGFESPKICVTDFDGGSSLETTSISSNSKESPGFTLSIGGANLLNRRHSTNTLDCGSFEICLPTSSSSKAEYGSSLSSGALGDDGFRSTRRASFLSTSGESEEGGSLSRRGSFVPQSEEAMEKMGFLTKTFTKFQNLPGSDGNLEQSGTSPIKSNLFDKGGLKRDTSYELMEKVQSFTATNTFNSLLAKPDF